MLIITLIAPSALAISIAIAFTGLSISSLESLTIIGIFVALALLILVVFSLAYLGIKSSRRIWLFVLTLAAVVPGGLILIDIIQAGQSSATPRYLIPVQLALQLSVTYLFASKIQFSSSARAKSSGKVS